MKKAKKSTRKPRTSSTSASRIALKDTIARKIVRKKKTAELKHLSWDQVETEEVTPLLYRQLIIGEQVMLARLLLKKGCVVPWHSHVNEQLSSILEGALKFWIDEKEIVVRAGEVLTIPPNMPHKAEALEDTFAIDTFHPPRADWINKTDKYLRK